MIESCAILYVAQWCCVLRCLALSLFYSTLFCWFLFFVFFPASFSYQTNQFAMFFGFSSMVLSCLFVNDERRVKLETTLLIWFVGSRHKNHMHHYYICLRLWYYGLYRFFCAFFCLLAGLLDSVYSGFNVLSHAGSKCLQMSLGPPFVISLPVWICYC